jgi:chemotaxis protein histidine kinase CheA
VGLGAARAACAQLGGVIQVQSIPGRGTRIEMRWPAASVFDGVAPLPKAA